MNLEDYKKQRNLLEGAIKLAIEESIEKFQKTTDQCPSKIKIEMLDITGFGPAQGGDKWRIKKRFKVGGVHAFVEL